MIDVIAFTDTILKTDVVAHDSQNVVKGQMMGNQVQPACLQLLLQHFNRIGSFCHLFNDFAQDRCVDGFRDTCCGIIDCLGYFLAEVARHEFFGVDALIADNPQLPVELRHRITDPVNGKYVDRVNARLLDGLCGLCRDDLIRQGKDLSIVCNDVCSGQMTRQT